MYSALVIVLNWWKKDKLAWKVLQQTITLFLLPVFFQNRTFLLWSCSHLFPPNSFISIIYWFYIEIKKFETTLKLVFVIYKIGQISVGWQNWRSSSNYENSSLVPNLHPCNISLFCSIGDIFETSLIQIIIPQILFGCLK